MSKTIITELNQANNSLSITVDGTTFKLTHLTPEEFDLFSNWDKLDEVERQARLAVQRQIVDKNLAISHEKAEKMLKQVKKQFGIT